MRQILKKFFIAVITAGICTAGLLDRVSALSPEDIEQDGLYHVTDFAGAGDLSSFASYAEAARYMDTEAENYSNLGIVYDGKVLRAEYALVYLRTTDACDVNISYVNEVDGQDGYVNGCSGKDAAYVATNEAGTRVQFLQAGVRGWASTDDVEIVPLENIETRISGYVVNDGTLYHEIKSEMIDDNYASIINNGQAPAYLEEGENYISYDGHYFYRDGDRRAMLDDYRSGTHDSSINGSDPFYDYYQFVGLRSVTSSSMHDFYDYLENTFGISEPLDVYQDDDKDAVDDTLSRSQYIGNLEAFWQYQYEYGANAMMMLAVSANESSFGRSSLSYTRNNLFAHAAYDNEEELNASRYFRVSHSVYTYDKYYISGSFCSPLRSQFHGGFFGNKSAGMNVSYTADPYWGEKAASYYRLFDSWMGSPDNGLETIGIKTSNEAVFVLQSPELTARALYKTSENPDMAFVILGELSNEYGDWYMVRSDATLDEDRAVDLSYEYDFIEDIGYIRKEDVQIILWGGDVNTDHVRVTFRADGGHFPGDAGEITYTLPAGYDAVTVIPEKDHALFTGWDKDTAGIITDTVFTAQYDSVTALNMHDIPKTEYEVNDRIDLEGGTVEVTFADGRTQIVPLTTSMVSGYNMMEENTYTVNVEYAGCTTEYTIHVDAEKDALRTDIRNRILDAIELYSGRKLTDREAEYILELKVMIDNGVLPQLTQTQYRAFDRMLVDAIDRRVRYIVEENDYGMSVSGLSLACPLDDSLSKSFWLADTYRVNIEKGIHDDSYDILSRSAVYQDNEIRDSFTIRLEKNFESYKPHQPLLFTIRKPEGFTEGEVFTVVHLADNGDAERCYTRQTAGVITFMGKGSGEYMVLSRHTSNDYADEDPVEAITVENSSYDLQKTLIVVGIGALLILILLIVWLTRSNRRRVRTTRERRVIKNEEIASQPLPPVDVTQVFQVFETEVLRLDEIEKARKEAEENDQYDD